MYAQKKRISSKEDYPRHALMPLPPSSRGKEEEALTP